MIRAVAEYHGQTALKPVSPAQASHEAVKRGSSLSVSSSSLTKSPGLIKSRSLKLNAKVRSSISRPLSGTSTKPAPLPTNPIQEELKNIKDALTSVSEFQSSAVEALEV